MQRCGEEKLHSEAEGLQLEPPLSAGFQDVGLAGQAGGGGAATSLPPSTGQCVSASVPTVGQIACLWHDGL